MRISPFVLALLLGATAAQAQTQASISSVEPATAAETANAAGVAEAEVTTAESAPAPVESAPAAVDTPQEEPRGPSRVVWLLVGAVAALGIILALTL